MKPLRLDWKGDAEVPAGARLVETETQWLAIAQSLRAPDARGVWVRGAHLCEWAAQWWQSAGGTCETVSNALDSLLSVVPNLSRDEAKSVTDALKARGQSQALALGEMLALLFPSFGVDGAYWSRSHSDDNRFEIAANWLLWLAEQDAMEPVWAKLVERQTEIWRESNPSSGDLFPATAGAARGAIVSWLGLEAQSARGAFAARPAFPVALPPPWLHRARDGYARLFTLDLGQREGDALEFWRAFERTNAPLALQQVAARTLAQWGGSHPQSISSQLIFTLEPLLPADALARLRALQPPRAPDALPIAKRSEANLVFDWVTQQYLPFRHWQCENEDAAARSISLAAAGKFGTWFLDFYGNAMVGAARKWLQIDRASKLRFENRGEITFWVIADGLGWLDARVLSQMISQANPRFSLLEMAPAFATIPTITKFAKPALRHSTTPDSVDEASENEGRREIEISGHKEAAGALRDAEVGDLIIWKPLEPDKTYHEKADASITRKRVAGALSSLAHEIVEAASAAPAHVKLQIVVTTDHGRMLGSSGREHAMPDGFVSSGRAAWGEKRPDLTNRKNLIWLDPEVYGCGSHVVIASDDGAFTTNASDAATPRAGVEHFAHGGIFPEEVVVPWLVFGRDVEALRLEAVLTGKGRAGRASRARLRLNNSSNRDVTLENIELSYGGQKAIEIALESVRVSGYHNAEIEINIADWPSINEARAAKIVVRVRTPDGRLVENEATAELQTEELQTRDDILGDLI